MSSLTFTEKTKIEKLLKMGGGHVSDFTNKTFSWFFSEKVEIDIDSEKYQSNGTSKAKKLNEFWRLESDYLVGKSINELVKYEEEKLPTLSERDDENCKILLQPCKNIASRLMATDNVNLNHLKKTTSIIFNTQYFTEQIRRMEQAVLNDPDLAIGTAKELIETCCKTILSEQGVSISNSADIPALTKNTLKKLNLVPENVSSAAKGSDVIKRVLQNLGAIGNGLAELRGLYGTGHGKHVQSKGLLTRHAKLAVGTASTLVTFLFDTHQETKKSNKQP